MKTIAERRQAVCDEAMTWEGTPYVPNARVKGRNGGVDCLTFIAGVYEGAGEIPRLKIPRYDHDWHFHQSEELYLMGKDDTPGVLHFCQEIEDKDPLPGDVLMYKFGLCFSHSAIVLDYPRIIHSFYKRPVGPDDAERRTVLKTIHEIIALRNTPRPRKLFRLKAWL